MDFGLRKNYAWPDVLQTAFCGIQIPIFATRRKREENHGLHGWARMRRGERGRKT
jgi:hypothetical protein